MRKAITQIQGEDGPTSVFICGREPNPFKRMKNRIRSWNQEKRREKAAQLIEAGRPRPKPMEEMIRYIKATHHASECDPSYPLYEERKRNLRCSLIQQYQPELLGEEKPIRPLKDLSDEQELLRWNRECREQIAERERRAAAVPEEAFPMDYRLFVVDRGEEGQLEVELELVHGELGCSYGGNKRVMDPILKDIYWYYGVSQEDIRQKTKRYRTLETILSK